MLIVEGSDLVGKTTFCKKLLEYKNLSEAGYIYKHFSRLPKSFDYCNGYMDNAVHNSVQDRYHMSEIVYSKVRREKESPLTPEYYRLVDGFLRSLGAFTIIITAHENLFKDRMRNDEMYDLDAIIEANRWFWGITRCPPSPYTSMDWDMHIHCTPEEPFPTDQNIRMAVTEYVSRQAQLRMAQETANRGPYFG